jgi:hypothetical protein
MITISSRNFSNTYIDLFDSMSSAQSTTSANAHPEASTIIESMTNAVNNVLRDDNLRKVVVGYSAKETALDPANLDSIWSNSDMYAGNGSATAEQTVDLYMGMQGMCVKTFPVYNRAVLTNSNWFATGNFAYMTASTPGKLYDSAKETALGIKIAEAKSALEFARDWYKSNSWEMTRSSATELLAMLDNCSNKITAASETLTACFDYMKAEGNVPFSFSNLANSIFMDFGDGFHGSTSSAFETELYNRGAPSQVTDSYSRITNYLPALNVIGKLSNLGASSSKAWRRTSFASGFLDPLDSIFSKAGALLENGSSAFIEKKSPPLRYGSYRKFQSVTAISMLVLLRNHDTLAQILADEMLAVKAQNQRIRELNEDIEKVELYMKNHGAIEPNGEDNAWQWTFRNLGIDHTWTHEKNRQSTINSTDVDSVWIKVAGSPSWNVEDFEPYRADLKSCLADATSTSQQAMLHSNKTLDSFNDMGGLLHSLLKDLADLSRGLIAAA